MMLDIDLNCVPPVDLAELLPAGVSEEYNDVQPKVGHTFIEIAREPFVPPMAGETDSLPEKRRGHKNSEELPVGWVVDEHVRRSGMHAGKKYKYFIEPGTGKKFRSMVEVRHHLGLLDSKPPKNKKGGLVYLEVYAGVFGEERGLMLFAGQELP